MSRPVWGAWIEIDLGGYAKGPDGKSRPVWGAWIEMGTDDPGQLIRQCRAPYGARGLNYNGAAFSRHRESRAPYGARGLKWDGGMTLNGIVDVAPRMGRVD